MKKRVVVALGHRALGTTLPEQKEAVKKTAKVIGDLIEKGYQVAVTHSNAPQVGMIHTAMNEFAKEHEDYTAAPMSVCSAMSQGYIGYDLQNAIREELMDRGIYRTVSTILTQVIVDPYDEAFLQYSKLGEYFKDFTCPAYTGRLKGENIRIIMERNGLSEAVYVGDTQGDANSCKEAEIPMIYAAYGFGEVEKADASIQSFDELLDIDFDRL